MSVGLNSGGDFNEGNKDTLSSNNFEGNNIYGSTCRVCGYVNAAGFGG